MILAAVLSVVFSCGSTRSQHPELTIAELTAKIKGGKLDLSRSDLNQIPDLSALEIKELDLSYNSIKVFDEKRLPKNLNSLDLSHNKINGVVNIKVLALVQLDLSDNKIGKVFIDTNIINNLDLSNNKLETVQMPLYSKKEKEADTLNISNNRRLDNYVSFLPNVYKHIIRHNIKNRRPLHFVLEKPIE